MFTLIKELEGLYSGAVAVVWDGRVSREDKRAGGWVLSVTHGLGSLVDEACESRESGGGRSLRSEVAALCV